MDPNVWAQLELRREELAFALRAEKVRRRRDILMSLAQSASMNPILGNAVIATAGAVVATGAEIARHGMKTAVDSLEDPKLKTELGRWKVPFTTLEATGKGMAIFAGANQGAEWVRSMFEAIRGEGAESKSIAFDIPDSEGPALLPAAAVAAPFR